MRKRRKNRSQCTIGSDEKYQPPREAAEGDRQKLTSKRKSGSENDGEDTTCSSASDASSIAKTIDRE